MEKKIPKSLSLCGGGVDIKAAAEGSESNAKTFTMDAYNGGLMQTGGWYYPLVIDLAGMSWTEKPRPILFQHDPERGVGFTKSIHVEAGSLKVSGTLLSHNEDAKRIANDAGDGFPWQASIGATVQQARFVDEKEIVNVNGQEQEGPLYVVEKSTLGEVSFVSLGADDSTSVSVAASAGCTDFISFESEEKEMTEKEVKAESVVDDGIEAAKARRAEYLKMAAEISEICAGYPSIEAEAIEKDWDVKDVKLAVAEAKLEASEAKSVKAPNVIATKAEDGFVFDKSVEAAAMKSAGLNEDTIVAHCGEEAVEASRKHNGIGFKGLILNAAARAGHYSASINDATIKAALSTADLSGILSNIANKTLAQEWSSQMSAVDLIASNESVSDFKTNTQYRLTTSGEFAQVPAGGEVQHGTLADSSKTHSADQYGMLITVDRTMMINDDLGALNRIGQQMVRLAFEAKEKAGMAKFMEITGFWTAGNGNLETTTPLNIDGLNTAWENMLLKTDANGDPIQSMPRYLVVPPALYATARQLMASTTVNNGATSMTPDANIHAGSMEVVTSPYLQNSNYTGYSSTDWYVLADPAVAPTLVMSYLNGNRSPMLEQVDLPADRLGMGWRCVYDFGADKGYEQGGVKCDAA